MCAYICPRCEYTTIRKSNMFDHFYKRKTKCNFKSNDIELTNEIKTIVLNDRIYVVKKTKNVNVKSMKHIINNIDNITNNNIDNITNNNINIFLNLDPIQKMNHHHKAINNTLLPIGDIISMLYENDISGFLYDMNENDPERKKIIKTIRKFLNFVLADQK